MTTAAITNEVPPLAADLVPVISDPALSMIIGRVAGLRSTNHEEGGLPVQEGHVLFYIVEVIHSPTLVTGTTIETPFKRIADRLRVKNSMDQWNTLPLNQGDLVLLACSPTPAPQVWIGRAARRLNGLGDSLVAAARQCYQIEQMQSPSQEKREKLEAALGAKQDLLVFYALDALGRRSLFGREVGARTVERAIASPSIAPEDKLELGSYLTRSYFFESNHKTDPANGNVLSALAVGLVNDSDAERRLEWAQYLKSCVFQEFSDDESEDHVVRRELLRSVRAPTPQQVIAVLLDLLKRTEDEDEKSDISDLIKAWRDAS